VLLLEFTLDTGEVFTHATGRPCLVGRAEAAGVLAVDSGEFVGLPDSHLSRPHCIFAPMPLGNWVVEDAGSATGTRLITGPGGTWPLLGGLTPVVAGMRLLIGRTAVLMASQ
jgi:hypothetical protein